LFASAHPDWTRKPPNTPSKTSGTTTIARTFQRTGQLLSAHRDGRFVCPAGCRGDVTGSCCAATSCGGSTNAVIAPRPYDR
jgi:hypothetical protein